MDEFTLLISERPLDQGDRILCVRVCHDGEAAVGPASFESEPGDCRRVTVSAVVVEAARETLERLWCTKNRFVPSETPELNPLLDLLLDEGVLTYDERARLSAAPSEGGL